VGTRDPKVVPQHLEVGGAGVHRVWRTGLDAGVAMTAQIGNQPLPAIRHLRDDLVPAAPGLGEAMEQRHRRTFADHLIVESNVSPLYDSHKQIVWM
jgi:hypothetical protein